MSHMHVKTVPRRWPAIESDAKELTDSAKALYTRSNNKVFTKDSGGSYDTDKIYKAVKRFADDYNSMLDTAGKSSTNRISRSVSSMKNETSYNEKPLKEIGITVDEKTGRLSVDETTFKSAHSMEEKEPVPLNRFFIFSVSALLNVVSSTDSLPVFSSTVIPISFKGFSL